MGIAISVIGGLIVYGTIEGGKAVWEEIKTTNGTVVAIADIVVDSESVQIHHWHTGDFRESIPYVDKGVLVGEEHYEYYGVYSVWIYWNEESERYESNDDSRFYYGDNYWPNIINDAYNYGRPGDAETRKKRFFVESGTTRKVDVLHAFDSSVDESSKDDLLADRGEWTYTPRAYAYVSDMRYGIIDYEEAGYGFSGTGGGWTYNATV